MQRHHLLPSDKTLEIPPKKQKAWFPNPNPPSISYCSNCNKIHRSHVSKKKNQSEMPRRLPPSSKEARQVILGLRGGSNRTHRKKAFFFLLNRAPPPISLAINTVSIGCQRQLPTVSPSFKAELVLTVLIVSVKHLHLSIHTSIHPSKRLVQVHFQQHGKDGVYRSPAVKKTAAVKNHQKDFGRSTIFGAEKKTMWPKPFDDPKEKSYAPKMFREPKWFPLKLKL